ncbi:Nitrilase [Lachnellula suecica]|uniref:Nitrilase n=1 Tax=Lachnellula suecica TaxID=602035 RepID=A0A8T9C0H9_9HELO|nr:Nitrilase [Lachnellula suecica]
MDDKSNDYSQVPVGLNNCGLRGGLGDAEELETIPEVQRVPSMKNCSVCFIPPAFIMASRFLAAACHVSPFVLSAQKTTRKCVSLIHQAAKNSANLVIFPESYIPAFPVWSAMLAPTQNHGFFERMAKESIYIDGEEMRAIRATAKQTGTVVSVGISEKVRYSTATLFNSNIIIGTDGEILVHHRKLMPTFFEKLTWSPGDGFGLRVAETHCGKIGALICGENTNPLARYSLMAQGEQVHISTWPAMWPTSVSGPRKESTGEGSSNASPVGKRANYDNVAANKTRAAAHCFENKCFGILCTGHLTESNVADIAAASSDPSYISKVMGETSRGATMFLDATGTALPGYIVDSTSGKKTQKEFLQVEEDILYAEMDLDKAIEGKQYHDVVGGYQRLDVFNLKVNRSRREPATFVDHDDGA